MFEAELKKMRKSGIRGTLMSLLAMANVLCSTLIMWKTLSVITNTESPIVVVLSGSMEPAFYRGDLLFLTLNPTTRLKVGDVAVYNVPGNAIPIVHRIIEVHDENPSGVEPTGLAQGVPEQWILTKGDNNHADDIGLYNGLRYLRKSHIVGKVSGYMPWVGYVTIAMNDYPKLKYLLLGFLALSVLFNKEEK